jgi:stage II sporulation protein D
LNGKAYRGKLEVFVNARGSLTVVNVVPLEDYLLGVVPSELGLPQLEAQKAQAVAARTYAIANIGTFGKQGFDMVPTIYSQVYKGVSIETQMGTAAVNQTRGIVATYQGKPIMAYFTSTCGGRTEDGGNIFDKGEPYLKGVECSLEGHRQFDPFLIKTTRRPSKLRDETNAELIRIMAILSLNGFRLSTEQMTDDWFDEAPSNAELTSWINQIGAKFGKVFGNLTKDSGKPTEIAAMLASMLYPTGTADTLLSDSDVNYQLAFDDAGEIPKDRRADVAILLRDGYFAIHPDLTLKPNKPFSRAKMIRLIKQIYDKKKWMPAMQSGTAKASSDGRLILKSGRSEKSLTLRPDVFLFRKFGNDYFPVREAAMVGGEEVSYLTDASGAVAYLEIKPSDIPTSAENMSPFTNWSATLSAGAVQSRLSRYVRGIGSLYDVNIKKQGYSRRAIELEIIGSNGVKTLKGGKIRSALRLNEQLFVINKRYSGSTVTSYTFTGRGWGHGVGMCQYGAFGMAKMGVKYDEIIKHYYTGVDLTKAY